MSRRSGGRSTASRKNSNMKIVRLHCPSSSCLSPSTLLKA
jgi:hypothetical protein